uniref:non-specific serine/threonine protein kinase n=1 Tax=Tetraodon nigroviridis TaxID=99883 RepID=H3C578_TETNG
HQTSPLFWPQPRRCWIEETFSRRECVRFLPSSRDLHRCSPGCQVCQNLIRCCCGRLIGEHAGLEAPPPAALQPGVDSAEDWSTERHTRASPTNAFGTIDFQDRASRVCRAKYVRLAVDTRAELLLQLMLKEWQMERPKLLLSVQGASENFTLAPKVMQAFSRGLMAAALSTGAWILTDGTNTGVSRYVGEAVRTCGSHSLRNRNTVGVAPWGAIDSNADLIGRDVFQPYQPVGNPLSRRACLNGFHSHFLLVDDGTAGKHGCQQGVRRSLEKHIQQQKIHPRTRLKLGVPVVCVLLAGGPSLVSTVLDYVSGVPPVPVFVFEGSGGVADLLAFLHKHTAMDRQLQADIKADFLSRVQSVFGVSSSEASQLCGLLQRCMEHRQCITILDPDAEEQEAPDAAILTAALKGTSASPAEQLSMTLAWNRADIAQKQVLASGQHWKAGSLEQALLDALLMDRVTFVKLLIDNGMTMSQFLTVGRLEELYNTPPQGQTQRFLQHLVEDVKQTSLPAGYRLSVVDVGLVIEYLIGGAYSSTYTRKAFRAAYSRLRKHVRQRLNPGASRSLQQPQFFRTAQPSKPKEQASPAVGSGGSPVSPVSCDAPPQLSFNFNDLFVWAVLQQRQQMALFLWQHGEEALARATVACKLYRSMAFEARQSSVDDTVVEGLKTFSREFGQLAVDVLDAAFRHNEQMAMKLLTSEMEAWSHFTCLQMAVSSGHRPFVSHSCTQTLLTDLWSGALNMRKNSFLKILLGLVLPPAILLLDFKSEAEMCHVPQSQEAMLFLDPARPGSPPEAEPRGGQDTERGPAPLKERPGPVADVSTTTLTCLSWIKRPYEFYTAPVVKFWFHTMFYMGFLMLFSYVVLVRMEERPSPQEWLLIAYIVSTALEKTREVLMSEPRKLTQKLKVWFCEYWNLSDFLAILLFLAGLALRCHGEPYRTAGRISYCLDLIFWFVRVLDLLAVNQHAGPYLTIITKMTRNMFFIVVMMAIVLLSFGVCRKAVLSPDSEPSWSLARDVVFQPYWMIFGEVYASELEAVCENEQPCPPAAFLAPLLQAVYMFLQYIIMVNILIAFFNNVYFDMASSSNLLWRYNRYRYIMTYQERPWLPPPLILLSHSALLLRAVCRRWSAAAELEGGASGLKLFLGWEDRKLLHEFEEKCVEAYFHEKRSSATGNQTSRIRATAERVEEMAVMVGEVTEKVSFIQDSLSELDSQLGHLQDLSALAVDTLTMLSASDSQHQEEARLAQCQPTSSSWRVHPHSWTQNLGDGLAERLVTACRSSPASLLKNLAMGGSRRPSQEQLRGRRADPDPEHGSSGVQSRDMSCWTTCSSYPKTCQPRSSPEPTIGTARELLSIAGGFSHGVLLSESSGASEGPAWVQEACAAGPRSSRRWRNPTRPSRSGGRFGEPASSCCRSLSSSMENLTFSSTRLRAQAPYATAGAEVPSGPDGTGAGQAWSDALVFSYRMDGGHWREESHQEDGEDQAVRESVEPAHVSPGTSGHSSSTSELVSRWSKDRRTSGGRLFTAAAARPLTSSAQGWVGAWAQAWLKPSEAEEPGESVGLPQPASASCVRSSCFPTSPTSPTSNQNLPAPTGVEPQDFMQKTVFSHQVGPFEGVGLDVWWSSDRFGLQDVWSPPHSAWNSWVKSMSRRSSLQSGSAPEVRSSWFQSAEGLQPHCSAVERNNLMRLATSIPFTPVSILGGEEVSIYALEEVSDALEEASATASWWSSRGLSAILQPVTSEEGSLDGLRHGCRVLCTWAEQDVLRLGLVYVVKAFRPEVLGVWQRYFHGSAALQLCLREIQQQRAAQKLMQVFNQIKPRDMEPSPSFLDVSLVLWHSKGQWLTIERNMTGEFRKYNNNTGEEMAPCCPLEELLLAFSHWTFEYSCRELLVLDIQGVGETLTDPTVVMAQDKRWAEMLFGPDNLGDAAIEGFQQKHSCRSACARLGL